MLHEHARLMFQAIYILKATILSHSDALPMFQVLANSRSSKCSSNKTLAANYNYKYA